MNDFLRGLADLDFDSLTAKEAVEYRRVLKEAVARSDVWFGKMARAFGASGIADVYDPPPKDAKGPNGRPPETPPQNSPVAGGEPSPVKPPPRRRGRPVPNLRVDLNVKKAKRPPATPIAVGGADSATDGPRPAQIFQESYVSQDGPRPGAALPPDHPRNFARPSSITPEVDMSDFHEVEEAMRKGTLGKVFQ